MAFRSEPSTSKGGGKRKSLNPTEITKILDKSDSESEGDSDLESDRYADDFNEVYAPEEATKYSDSADSEDDEPPPKRSKRLDSKSKPDTLPSTGSKRIFSLKTACDPENYSPYAYPKKVQELKVDIKSKDLPVDELVWINKPKKTVGRKKEPHIFRGSNVNGQVKREYRKLKTPVEVFDHLFDEEIMNTILGISESSYLFFVYLFVCDQLNNILFLKI